VLDELSSALRSARAALSNFLDLVSLEARRAGIALMWMVVCGVVAAICMVAAWLGLMAALAMWAVALGVPPLAAVIAVAMINLVAGAVLIYVCIGMSCDLLFSATRRQVAGKSPLNPPTP
jgi:flagellar motor component MotA